MNIDSHRHGHELDQQCQFQRTHMYPQHPTTSNMSIKNARNNINHHLCHGCRHQNRRQRQQSCQNRALNLHPCPTRRPLSVGSFLFAAAGAPIGGGPVAGGGPYLFVARQWVSREPRPRARHEIQCAEPTAWQRVPSCSFTAGLLSQCSQVASSWEYLVRKSLIAPAPSNYFPEKRGKKKHPWLAPPAIDIEPCPANTVNHSDCGQKSQEKNLRGTALIETLAHGWRAALVKPSRFAKKTCPCT